MDNKHLSNSNKHKDIQKMDIFKYRIYVEIQRAERRNNLFSIASINFSSPVISDKVYPKDIFTLDLVSALTSTMRNLDILTQDEQGDFLILLSEASTDIAITVIKRMIDQINLKKTGRLESRVYAGISTFPFDSKDSSDLIRSAKYAMFHASKKNKRDIVTISEIRKGLSWEEEANEVLSHTKKRFNKIIETTIKSLLSTVSIKDKYLEDHSIMVARISSILAERLNLSESYIRDITLASLLHDIGYLEIPQQILNKRGELDAHEFEIIKQHPLIATESILKPIKSLENLLPLIKDHHEKSDGSGYPSNKFQKDIHIGARIISIADVYHALISNRPYRPAYTHVDSLEILRQNSNLFWDESVVNTFIEMMQDPRIYNAIFKT